MNLQAERVVDAWQICVVTNENGVARPEIRFVAKQMLRVAVGSDV